MLLDQIRKMSNPYYPITARLEPKEFVGREDATNQLVRALEEYKATMKLNNILISGDKSVGKSTLLYRYKQIVQDYGFAVHELELPRGQNTEIDEFEIIRELIDELFEKYGGDESGFFNSHQSEIWFSLTRDKYDHESNFMQRQLDFPTRYANRKKGLSETLSYRELEKDFANILDELLFNEMEIFGLAILIDEFQELGRNSLLLDMLRMLSERLTGILIIGAGMPTFMEMPSFEKFSRISLLVPLENMDEDEVIDLILRPLELRTRASRHEVRNCFDLNSLCEIEERSGGNPLHIRVLCANMFDCFQKNPDWSVLKLNREVMDKAMGYYSSISEKSRRIARSLRSCTRDHLEAFRRLYYYEGFDIRSAILSELAFQSIQEQPRESVRRRIIRDFQEIQDLALFEFSDEELTIKSLEGKSVESLAHVEYKFIGDAIDKLYASYFYEDLTQQRLEHHRTKNFEELLTRKLAEEIGKAIGAKRVPEGTLVDKCLMAYQPVYEIQPAHREEIITDLDSLVKAASKGKRDKNSEQLIAKLSRKHRLQYAAIIASIFEYTGYYLLISDVTVRGKTRFIFNFFPVKGDISEIMRVSEQITDHEDLIEASLHEYMITVNWMYLYFLPKRPLLIIYYINVQNEVDLLYKRVGERRFEEAVEIAKRIYALEVKLREKEMLLQVESLNNYAFCLVNINSLEEAKSIFQDIQNQYLLSKVNLAYVLFVQEQWKESASILKKVLKKLDRMDKAKFLHLAIRHDSLSLADSIVEDINIFNIVAWNLALIHARYGDTETATFSYYKKAQPKGDDHLIHKRVRNWIAYYLGDKERALADSKRLLNDCDSASPVHRDVSKDIEIFEEELAKLKKSAAGI